MQIIDLPFDCRCPFFYLVDKSCDDRSLVVETEVHSPFHEAEHVTLVAFNQRLQDISVVESIFFHIVQEIEDLSSDFDHPLVFFLNVSRHEPIH